ncbi:50S ribosomal protein L24 [Campylobacter jejuni]|nr:50S ribosomal protein L24 [Campylobacter jejuni]
MKIKKGDSVKVITGDDKGKTGKVLAVYPKTLKVVVEGCKIAKKLLSRVRKPNGGFINKEMPMDISNVAKVQE